VIAGDEWRIDILGGKFGRRTFEYARSHHEIVQTNVSSTFRNKVSDAV